MTPPASSRIALTPELTPALYVPASVTGSALRSAGAVVLGSDAYGQPGQDGAGPIRRAGDRGRDHRRGHRPGCRRARVLGGPDREGRLRVGNFRALVPAGAWWSAVSRARGVRAGPRVPAGARALDPAGWAPD